MDNYSQVFLLLFLGCLFTNTYKKNGEIYLTVVEIISNYIPVQIKSKML